MSARSNVGLGRNELPYQPPDSVRTAASGALRDVNRYPSRDGFDLRCRIAKQFRVEPDWIVVANGSISVIQQAMLVAGPGEVIFSWPSFDAFPPLAAALGMRANLAGLTPDGGCDLADISARINVQTRLIIICTPNTPTGGVVRHQELMEFAAAVPRGVITLIDGAYAEFISDFEAMPDADLVRVSPAVVMTRTFSKAYALAGLRVGYGIARPELAREIVRTGVPYAVSGVAESAAIEALSQPDYMRRNVERITAERARLASGLRRLGLEVVAGHGNFVWLPMPERMESVVAALARQGVMVKSYPGHGIRISVGTSGDTDRLLSSWPDWRVGSLATPTASTCCLSGGRRTAT